MTEQLLHLTLDGLVSGIEVGGGRGFGSGFASPIVCEQRLDHLVAEHDQCGHGAETIWGRLIVPPARRVLSHEVFATQLL